MKRISGILAATVALCSLCAVDLHAFQAPAGVSLPRIEQRGAVKQLVVDGKPFVMLAGELHNSSASSVEYMQPIWDRLQHLNLNTVVSTVSWELLEPEEGKFDYTLVDAQIEEARKHGLRLVLIWFGAWKNGESTYAPMWVKSNHERFPVQLRKPRPASVRTSAPPRAQRDAPLSPFSLATMSADARAYKALIHHLKERDPLHTVVMVQVENELGLLGDSRDRSTLADAAWAKPVPQELTAYLSKNKDHLLPETAELWAANGYKTTGTWSEVFGTNEWAEEAFMAWHYALFVQRVVSEGKAEMNLPMYVNAWLGPQPGAPLPGDWPTGGPVARVTDIWRAAAPAIDLYAPDIYVDDFKGTTDLYTRSGNPLFIPEARDQAGNLFWALGRHAALGWSVFGVDDLSPDGQIAKSYRTLEGILPQLPEWQSQGKVSAALLVEGQESETTELGGYKITVSKPPRRGGAASSTEILPQLQAGGVAAGSRALPADTRPFCLVVNTSADEFVILGSNVAATFALLSEGKSLASIGSIDEGHFENGRWIAGRRLNGDEGRLILQPMQWNSKAETLTAVKVRLYRSSQ